MKEIRLTKGMVALVDDEDFEELNKHKWHASNKRSHGRDMWYACRRKGKKIVSMHREIMGTPAGQVCDHGDKNTLNNQRWNLTNVTHLVNMYKSQGWNRAPEA